MSAADRFAWKEGDITIISRGDEEKGMPGGSNGPKPGASAELNAYWTRGAGLARWAEAAHPYTTLVAQLRSEGVPERMVNGLAATYYHRVFKRWPGKHK